jgi:hypothetical protein
MDDILCETIVDSSEEKIANLKLIREAIVKVNGISTNTDKNFKYRR